MCTVTSSSSSFAMALDVEPLPRRAADRIEGSPDDIRFFADSAVTLD